MVTRAHLLRWFPFLAWPRPSRALLRGEFWAGMTVGLMLVPQGGGCVEEGRRGGDGGFGVLPEPSISIDPGEEALDDPPPGLNGEADLIGLAPDDLDGDAGGGRDTRALVASVREDLLDEGERAARGGQQRARPIAILHAGGMGEEDEATPVGIDEGVALATHDLLAGVVATGPTGFVRFHALAVDDAGAGRGRPTAAFAIDHQQRMVESLEHAPVSPGRKPAIGRALGRKVARQKPPGDASAHDVKDRVDDLAQRPGERPARPLRRR